MIHLKDSISVLITIIFLTMISVVNCHGQSKSFEENKKELKKILHFDDWQGKNKGMKNGINLSREKISVLLDVTEIRPKNIFFISQNINGDFFVMYRSKWSQSEKDFVEITISFLNSNLESHEYLFDQYILGSTLPLNTRENSLDNPSIVGDVSFYKGRIFIRNNIVVKIHAEGKMSTLVESIAKEIDKLILSQDIVDSYDKFKPRIVKDNNDKKIIIEP